MIEVGAVLLAISVAGTGACLIRPSAVEQRLATVALAADLARRAPRAAHLLVTAGAAGRSAAAIGAALLAVLAGLPLIAPALGYAAFVLPSVLADRRRARERAEAERSLGIIVEWADALVSVGQPAERAFAAAARHGSGSQALDLVLRQAGAAAALGAPLFRALAAESRGAGLPQLADLADELDRARDLGRGSRSVVRDARDELRRRERSSAIAAAASVDAKLLLILVACYLPVLMLTVVVPLFVGLLGGLLE